MGKRGVTRYTDLQPPPIKRQSGRPKKKRNKDPSELLRDDSKMKKARNGIKCCRCKQFGHNKSTCKLPPPPPPPPTENQSESQSQTISVNQPTPTTTTTTTTSTQPPVTQSIATQTSTIGSHPSNRTTNTQGAAQTQGVATHAAAKAQSAANKQGVAKTSATAKTGAAKTQGAAKTPAAAKTLGATKR